LPSISVISPVCKFLNRLSTARFASESKKCGLGVEAGAMRASSN
jgi:hypothetical protein